VRSSTVPATSAVSSATVATEATVPSSSSAISLNAAPTRAIASLSLSESTRWVKSPSANARIADSYSVALRSTVSARPVASRRARSASSRAASASSISGAERAAHGVERSEQPPDLIGASRLQPHVEIPSAIRSALSVSCRREMTVFDPTVTPISASPITVNSVIPMSPERTSAPAAPASPARR